MQRLKLFADFFFSTSGARSTASSAIKILFVGLFLCLPESDFTNYGKAYAQQVHDSNKDAGTLQGISSAGTFEISLDVEPFPIEQDRQTMLNIKFIRLAEPAVPQVNVGFDIFVLDENNNVIFRASNTTSGQGEDDDLPFSANGTVHFPYRFESAGDYTVQVKVLRVNFIPIHPEFVSFPIAVIPEFGSLNIATISAGTLALIIIAFQLQKLVKQDNKDR